VSITSTPLTSITSILPAADAPSPYLASLLDQTRAHLASPDARLLLARGSENMTARLVGTIKTEVYGIPEYTVLPAQNINKRLVDCLPAIGQWGRDVWQSVPDGGVESVLTMPEFESFAGLIVGDWSK
jgi:peroxin-3